ncbi:ornithine carbamoyltransferase [Thiospirillum jenense]|uniref:Ornithine carbamoyltransferase n=1 Tax=Thiospirillum jenense TaxID=1653858 RepID=A0A839HF82_9GAMM|nr:ornithine carbamoyltransferase [Thiospirillum jenense]MBB1125679.1 ornithine carbamoyltransferase [Thiospirillum jenense]
METQSHPSHFLTLLDLTPDAAQQLIQRAIELKQWQRAGVIHTPLKQRTLGMIFEKSSTRTRVSFEVGMVQLGGHALFLSPRDTQLGRGEPIPDTARVLSRMVDAIMIRTFEHDTVELFAQHSSVPVINGLTDRFHPCQVLADIQTYYEQRGTITGCTVAYIGDGNNMCNSYLNAAQLFDFHLKIACPDGFEPAADVLNRAAGHYTLMRDPNQAATNADLIITDVWASMGQEADAERRCIAFANYCVNDDIMAHAKSDALFMHCLPAHRGEEVSASVIDGPQSVVWDEAENRLHAQKALLEYLLVTASIC